MKFYTLPLILLIFSLNELYSQDLQGRSITVSAREPSYSMETSCDKKNFKIKVIIKDSTNNAKVWADSTHKAIVQYLRGLKSIDIKNDTVLKALKRTDSVIALHTVYFTDSIQIPYKQYPAYTQLLNALFTSSESALENHDQRIILDGIWMSFKFYKNKDLLINGYAHSPSKYSHPMLYAYLKSTIDIYKKEQKNRIPDKYPLNGRYQ
jgi:hypothetical protein